MSLQQGALNVCVRPPALRFFWNVNLAEVVNHAILGQVVHAEESSGTGGLG